MAPQRGHSRNRRAQHHPSCWPDVIKPNYLGVSLTIDPRSPPPLSGGVPRLSAPRSGLLPWPRGAGEEERMQGVCKPVVATGWLDRRTQKHYPRRRLSGRVRRRRQPDRFGLRSPRGTQGALYHKTTNTAQLGPSISIASF